MHAATRPDSWCEPVERHVINISVITSQTDCLHRARIVHSGETRLYTLITHTVVLQKLNCDWLWWLTPAQTFSFKHFTLKIGTQFIIPIHPHFQIVFYYDDLGSLPGSRYHLVHASDFMCRPSTNVWELLWCWGLFHVFMLCLTASVSDWWLTLHTTSKQHVDLITKGCWI